MTENHSEELNHEPSDLRFEQDEAAEQNVKNDEQERNHI